MNDEYAKPATASLKVPKGFFTLMELFVRALMQNKPLDVFDYGAKFFENLLQVRTATGHNPAIHGAKTEDGFVKAGLKLHTECGKPNCKKCKKMKGSSSQGAVVSDTNVRLDVGSGSQNRLGPPQVKIGDGSPKPGTSQSEETSL